MPIDITVEEAIRHGRFIIDNYEEFVRGHETYTRYTIIDPILWGLGWCTWRPNECEVEYQRGVSGQVDYALFNRQGGLVVLLEAKRLGNNSANYERQLSKYSRNLESGIGVLVDGQMWHYYDLSKRGAFARKYVGTTDIYNNTINQAAQTLEEMIGKRTWW